MFVGRGHVVAGQERNHAATRRLRPARRGRHHAPEAAGRHLMTGRGQQRADPFGCVEDDWISRVAGADDRDHFSVRMTARLSTNVFSCCSDAGIALSALLTNPSRPYNRDSGARL